MQQRQPKEYGGRSDNSYGGAAKSWYPQKNGVSAATSGDVTKRTSQYDNDLNALWNKYGAQLTGSDTKPKATGPNGEMAKAAVTAKKETPFLEKVENQSVNYAKGGWKLFDWMDDFGNNKGPNSEVANTTVGKKEQADLTAGTQGKSPFKNPILDYDDMINPPDEKYQYDENFWREISYNGYGKQNEYINSLIEEHTPFNRAEIRTIIENPLPYVSNIPELIKAKSTVIPIKNDIFYYNENEIGEMNNNKKYSKYAAGLDGGLPNAFQYMFLAALITDAVGESEARKFLTAHETFSDLEYDNNILAIQQEVPIEIDTEYYNKEKLYPTKKHHAEMDLQNNDIGIQIALTTPYSQTEIEDELSEYLDKGETIGYLRHAYPNLTDRQILMMKKALKAIDDNQVSVIWDFLE